MIKIKNKRLILKSESIRILSSDQVTQAIGGQAVESGGVPCVTYTSFVQCPGNDSVLHPMACVSDTCPPPP